MSRPTVSLILPVSTTGSSNEQMITLDTVVSIDDTKRSSSSMESIEQKNKYFKQEKIYQIKISLFSSYRVYKLVYKKKDQSCVCWIVREIIQIICVALFASLIAMFAFTLIFYAFDIYWLEQPIMNNSLWWFYNNTNFTDFDYDIVGTTHTINYDDEY